MVENHLAYFKQLDHKDPDYLGTHSLNWARYILGQESDIDEYLNSRLNRYELFGYCQDINKTNLNILVAILSWGGMNRRHGKSLFQNLDGLYPVIEKLRNREFESRSSAFEALQRLRRAGMIPGLGIGYFTKLICFLDPTLNGYILDQWVGKSINLLLGEPIIDITNIGWVNDNNTHKVYEAFCSEIDSLSRELKCDGFEVERRLFSIGYGKGKWRNYLIKNYS